MQCLCAEYSCPKKVRIELNGSTSQLLREELKKDWNSWSVHKSVEEVLSGTVGFKKRDDANKERKESKEPGILPSARYTGNPARAVCPAVSSEPKDPTLSFPSQGLSVRLPVFLFTHALLQG